MPDGPDPAGGPAAPPRPRNRGRVILRAPSPPVTAGLIALTAAVVAVFVWPPPSAPFVDGWLLAFALPGLGAAVLSTPLASALGGRLEFHRSLFLAFTALLLDVPLAGALRGASALWPSVVPSLVLWGPFLIAPLFWFRHLTLYGVARPSHARILPVSLVQPILQLAGFYALVGPTTASLAATGADLVLAFVCGLVVLHAADRPIRREFHSSGVSMIRPLLDHVGARDPEATQALESFFLRANVRAEVGVGLLSFSRGDRRHVTVALPSVHPGPFAALGASDLPRKLEEFLGPDAGTVLVPHTPSDHDLDLPSGEELARIGTAARELLTSLSDPLPERAGPLVAPYPGSLARAQLLGDVALVVVSQAPSPTDDIAYPVADRIARALEAEGRPRPVLIDAHNSYVEDEGDISYGSPLAEKLLADARAAVAAAEAAARDGPLEIGVASRGGYSIGRDGVGPCGLRAIVLRSAGRTTGYVLIDGNNLVVGARAKVLAELEKVVDVAEVLTTDNHVVHEVDGGTNPVGERYPVDALARDARATLEAALADLAPTRARFGRTSVPDVRVLGPGYTARLLTSLGDTLSMFANMFPAALVLLLTSTLVVALVLR